MATALAYALKSRETFDDSASSDSSDVSAQDQEERNTMIGQLITFDVLMGVLVAVVAYMYNSEEQNFLWKVATVVFAFFFWHLYALYFLIRAGILEKPKAMGSLSEILSVPSDLGHHGIQLLHQVKMDTIDRAENLVKAVQTGKGYM